MTRTAAQIKSDIKDQEYMIKRAQDWPFTEGHREEPARRKLAALKEELLMSTGNLEELEDALYDAKRVANVTKKYISTFVVTALGGLSSTVLGGLGIVPALTLGLGIPFLVLSLIIIGCIVWNASENSTFELVYKRQRQYNRALNAHNERIIKGEISL